MPKKGAAWRKYILALLFLPHLISSIVLLRAHLKPDETSPFSGTKRFVSDRTRSRRDFWEEPGSTCFHLDHACHGNDTWFYRRDGTWPGESIHQPAMIYWQESRTHGFKFLQRLPFNISSRDVAVDDASCPYDPTPHHAVLQSAHNTMMGEFYSRTILGLNRWMRDLPTNGDDLQMHIHFVVKMKHQKLMHGHRLFLGGLPNNDKFDNFYEVMRDETCRCFRKLIFCGYRVHNATMSSKIATERNLGMESGSNGVTVFSPDVLINHPATACAFEVGDPSNSKSGECDAYRTLRRDLANTYSRKDPMLRAKIRQTRMKILWIKGAVRIGSSDIDGWKIVGVARRKHRRKWLNLNESISVCDEIFRSSKIVCIAIDVEEMQSAEEQLLVHSSLDAFVGIHGAQLAQGVLLRDGGYVLELLPWVPSYLTMGDWVATTDRPTPLGVVFHNARLNHVGYPLGRESVPLCLDVDPSNATLERECLTNKTNGMSKKFRWDERDFTVRPGVVQDFIETFLVNEDGAVCDDLQRRAAGKKFVLYNVLCRTSSESHEYRIKHYYRNQTTSR